MANLKGSKTEDNLKAAFAGESQANRRYLYFAQKADVEGYNDVAAVFRSTAEGETGHAHGHLEFLEVSRRSGDRPADRRHRRQPQGRDRRRDARIHRHVSGHGAHRARGRLRRDRRLVRDPGQGREEPRRPLPEGARHDGLSLRGLYRRGTREGPLFRPAGHRFIEKRTVMREGSLEAPTRHALDWQNPWFWDEAALEKEMERVFDICHGCRRCFNLCDSFPRLFDLIDNGPTGELDGVDEGGLRQGRGSLHALRHVLHDQVPLRAAARMGARLPASDAAPSRGEGAQGGHRASSRPSSPRPTATVELGTLRRAGLANWASDEHNKLTRPLMEKWAGIHHGAAPAEICRPRHS